jgi:hypothetical protein
MSFLNKIGNGGKTYSVTMPGISPYGLHKSGTPGTPISKEHHGYYHGREPQAAVTGNGHVQQYESQPQQQPYYPSTTPMSTGSTPVSQPTSQGYSSHMSGYSGSPAPPLSSPVVPKPVPAVNMYANPYSEVSFMFCVVWRCV